MSFIDLPEDILLLICANLYIRDLLALSETCRGFHAFISNDYVWHHIKSNVPLDLDCDRSTLPSSHIRRAFVRALQLERNWAQIPSTVKSITKIEHGDIVFRMQFLGSKWLLTLSKDAKSVHLSVWHLTDTSHPEIMRCATLDIPDRATNFCANLHNHQQASVAILSGSVSTPSQLSIDVYSVPLVFNPTNAGDLALVHCKRITWLKKNGSIHEIQISGSIVAVTVAKFSLGKPAYKILLADVSTDREVVLDSPLFSEIGQIQLRLDEKRLVIVGVRSDRAMVVSVFDGLKSMDSEKTGDLPGSIKVLEAPLFTYEVSVFSSDMTFYLPELLDSASRFLPVLVFSSPPAYTTATNPACALSIPMADNSGAHQLMLNLKTPASAVAEYVCIGMTGYRAVWLERHWETDEFVLMKGAFRSELGNEESAHPLLPSHLALPFEMHTCVSLCFEESSGRVCLGLHTGDLYVLQF